MIRRAVLIVAVCVGLVAAGGGVSWAGTTQTKHPPRVTVLWKHAAIQSAGPYTTCWSYEYPDGTGSGYCADGIPSYPTAAFVGAPRRVDIRIHYPIKPRRWMLRAAPKVRHRRGMDVPVNSHKLAFRLAAHRVRGEVTAWDVIARLPKRDRDYYIDTGGFLAQGDVWYTLHLRT